MTQITMRLTPLRTQLKKIKTSFKFFLYYSIKTIHHTKFYDTFVEQFM